MGEINQRKVYGKTLVELGHENPDIVVLDADLGGSTMGKMFEAEFPERHIEMSIAEANMLSVSAGLAQTGKIPFANSFAVFVAGRAFDQIRQTISIGKLNVKICGSSAGLSDFGDGATHQSVEDLAIMRAIPNMTVLCPADANEMGKAVRAAAAFQGPCYLRANRNDYENVTAEDAPFEIGRPTVLREGTDIVVFAIGYMNNLALAAAQELSDRVSVKVVNMSTLKPVNTELLHELAAGAKGIVTVEEHSVLGGLGGTISEVFGKDRVPIQRVGINDVFGCSAHGYQELLEHYGLTKEHIVQAILDVVKA